MEPLLWASLPGSAAVSVQNLPVAVLRVVGSDLDAHGARDSLERSDSSFISSTLNPALFIPVGHTLHPMSLREGSSEGITVTCIGNCSTR